MPLMDRIKTVSFLSMSLVEQTELVRLVQESRVAMLKTASTKPKRKTVAKTKSKVTRKTAEQKAKSLLSKLSPAQLEALMKGV